MKRRKFIALSGLLTAGWGTTPVPLQTTVYPTFTVLPTPEALAFPAFDLSKIPFSYRGSFHTINKIAGTHRLRINTVRRSAVPFKWASGWAFECFDISLYQNGSEIVYETTVTPWALVLRAGEATAGIVFQDENALLIQNSNCSFGLIPVRGITWKYPQANKGYVVFDNQTNQYCYITTADGSPVTIIQRLNKANETEDIIQISENKTAVFNIVTEEITPVLPALGFKEIHDLRKQEIEGWMSKMPAVKKSHENAARVGWYLFWNLQIKPWGNYSRQSILSSKKSMNMIWSWDICFNALTVVKTDHALAWDQLFAILDKQKPNGLLPDAVSDLMSVFGFNKPPVWGWTVMKMLEHTPKPFWKKYLEAFYPKVARFHHWWYQNRDSNKNGICEYAHGNDSGWDNATIFDEKQPVESPDLTAFLILEADALAYIARFLGKATEALAWEKQSADQLQLFHRHFVEDGTLVYKVLNNDGTATSRKSTSLLTWIPLVLGNKLDAKVRQHLVAELKEENVFLCAHGVASEALTSAKYEPNGYWRGPVWGPSTYLIVEGLRSSGETELARTIAQRFCDMVSKAATFHENYNAVTGEGQYDSGLTWTSSDFIMMAAWLQSTEK